MDKQEIRKKNSKKKVDAQHLLLIALTSVVRWVNFYDFVFFHLVLRAFDNLQLYLSP